MLESAVGREPNLPIQAWLVETDRLGLARSLRLARIISGHSITLCTYLLSNSIVIYNDYPAYSIDYESELA